MSESPLIIVLIEDTPEQGLLFQKQIRKEFGGQTQVNWFESIGEALQFLESVKFVDQIYVDRGLPGIEREADFSRALESLKNYSEPGQVRILAQSASPAIAQKDQRVEVLQKNEDIYDKIFALVGASLAKKSSGATLKIENARMMGQLEFVKYQAEENQKDVQRLFGMVEQIPDLRHDISDMKESVAGMLEGQKLTNAAISDIAKRTGDQISAVEKRLDNRDEMMKNRQARYSFFAAVITVVIGTFATPVVLKLLDNQAPQKNVPITNPSK